MTQLTLDELLERVRELPPMTKEQQQRQALDFAYGNLACTNRHQPSRSRDEEGSMSRSKDEDWA